MFAAAPLEPAPVCLSFKASSENFIELTERIGIIPAPYLARAQWVALESRDALRLEELARLLRESYDLIAAKLPKKTRAALLRPPARKRTPARGNSVRRKIRGKKKLR